LIRGDLVALVKPKCHDKGRAIFLCSEYNSDYNAAIAGELPGRRIARRGFLREVRP
jgi:hypothetical protein